MHPKVVSLLLSVVGLAGTHVVAHPNTFSAAGLSVKAPSAAGTGTLHKRDVEPGPTDPEITASGPKVGRGPLPVITDGVFYPIYVGNNWSPKDLAAANNFYQQLGFSSWFAQLRDGYDLKSLKFGKALVYNTTQTAFSDKPAWTCPGGGETCGVTVSEIAYNFTSGDHDFLNILMDSFQNGQLPYDENGLYFFHLLDGSQVVSFEDGSSFIVGPNNMDAFVMCSYNDFASLTLGSGASPGMIGKTVKFGVIPVTSDPRCVSVAASSNGDALDSALRYSSAATISVLTNPIWNEAREGGWLFADPASDLNGWGIFSGCYGTSGVVCQADMSALKDFPKLVLNETTLDSNAFNLQLGAYKYLVINVYDPDLLACGTLPQPKCSSNCQ